MLMEYHTGDRAETGKNYMSILRCQVLGNARITASKLFLQKLRSSDHNYNLQLAILGT